MEMEITFPGGARVDANFGGMTVKTDQPVQGGGQGSAPTPFATFLASIGTCAGIYVLGFCRRRGLSVDGLRLVQRVEWNQVTHMVDRVSLEVHLPPDFPEKYRPALVKAADQCKVKKHLEHPPMFDVKTVVAG